MKPRDPFAALAEQRLRIHFAALAEQRLRIHYERIERGLRSALARGDHEMRFAMSDGRQIVYDLRTLDADATGTPREGT